MVEGKIIQEGGAVPCMCAQEGCFLAILKVDCLITVHQSSLIIQNFRQHYRAFWDILNLF